MNIKKAMLLATMALATISAALATSAMAETEGFWSDKGTKLTGAAEFTLEGKEKFNTLGNGIECKVKAVVTANEGGVVSSTGKVHLSFPNATNQCVGFGATFKKCKVENIENTSASGDLTFIYHLTDMSGGGRAIVVTEVNFSTIFENKGAELCPDKTMLIAVPKIQAIPNNGLELSSVTFEAEGTAQVDGGEAQPNVLTTVEPLKVLAPNVGTYGIL